MSVFTFFLIEIILILLGSFMIALREPLYAIYGDDIQLIESVGIGMCGGFQWCAILTIWTYMARVHRYPVDKYALLLILIAAISTCLFTVLDYFYVSRSGENPRKLYFSRGDMKLRVITTGFIGFGAPVIVLGYLTLGPTSASLCLFISGGIALLASIIVSDDYLNLDQRHSGVKEGFIIICTIGFVFGSMIGAAHAGIWGGILYPPLGIIGLVVLLGLEFSLVWVLYYILSPLLKIALTKIRFREVICDNCYRYTAPLKSKYQGGERKCEHCAKNVEHTKEVGKVIFSFGDYGVDQDGRKFIFKNPNFVDIHAPRDVSEVYIDVDSTDPVCIERFVAQVRELFPPKKGLDSITIFHRGDLSDLGQPIVNLITNNFDHVLEA